MATGDPTSCATTWSCPTARVKWVCDKDASKLAKAKKRYPGRAGDRATTPTSCSDPEVDAVLVATPISTHFGLALAAIEAGKHVFVEKPMTASVLEARALVAAAAVKGVTLMVGHTFEFSSPVVAIKRMIASGELGEVYYVSSSRINLGLHQKDVSVIWDLAPHDLSILFDWLGEEPRRHRRSRPWLREVRHSRCGVRHHAVPVRNRG